MRPTLNFAARGRVSPASAPNGQFQIAQFRLIKVAVSFVMMVGLNGCVAAPMVFAGATFGYGFYSQYHLSTGGAASFEIERNDPSPTAINEIRSAKSIIIFPDGSNGAGVTVDVFRARTDLSVVSSTKTLPWVKENGVLNFSSIPRDEKHGALKRFAQAHSANLALLVEADGGPKASGSVLLFNLSVTTKFKTTVISGQTGEILWTEKHQLKVVRAVNTPSTQELIAVVNTGIADRLMELRTGRKREGTEKEKGLFDCGGLLNFTCNEDSKAGGTTQPDEPGKSAVNESETRNQGLVRTIQLELKERGYYRLGIDGIYGPGTKTAISHYQRDNNISVDGQPTMALLSHIRRP